MPDATCATCPWCRHIGNSCGGHCRLNPPSLISRTETAWPWVPEKGWCSAHPLRAPRVCLNCKGTGYAEGMRLGSDGYSWEPDGTAEHCETCHGTGHVVPEVSDALDAGAVARDVLHDGTPEGIATAALTLAGSELANEETLWVIYCTCGPDRGRYWSVPQQEWVLGGQGFGTPTVFTKEKKEAGVGLLPPNGEWRRAFRRSS